MASISADKNGTLRSQFSGADNRRKTLRLGKCSKRDAEIVRARVELLLAAQLLGTSPEPDTLRWLANTHPKLRDRLVRVGLVVGVSVPRATKKITLHTFINDYIAERSKSVKPSTRLTWQVASDSIFRALGKDLSIHHVNAAHAQKWIDTMRGDGLKPTTIHKRLQFGKQFLNHAVAAKVIAINPWSSVKMARPKVVSNVEVERSTIDRLMLVMDQRWRSIVALARYGGMRCPSEVLSIRWEQIDWEESSMTVPSPKTEHISGGASRTCPLFRELRAVLEPYRKNSGFIVDADDLRAKASGLDGWATANLRSGLIDYMKRAGVTPWARLFHSMRASRQTELEKDFGLAAACAWLGNTQSVAKQHYLLVTSEAWKKAT